MYDTIKLEVFCHFILQQTDRLFNKNFEWGDNRKRVFNTKKYTVSSNDYHGSVAIYEKLENNEWYVYKYEIEASLRKLVWQSSYFGVFEKDTDLVISALLKDLRALGIVCSAWEIERANVLIIAYSLNFYFGSEIDLDPRELALALVRLDVGRRMGKLSEQLWVEMMPGYGVKWHNSRRGLSIYDKVAEIANNKKQTPQDLAVLLKVEAGELPRCFEIENTLQNRTAIKKAFVRFDGKKRDEERHIRDVLRDKVAIAYLMDSLNRVCDPKNVKALETPIYPLEDYYRRAKVGGLNFVEAQSFLAQCVGVQQLGSLRLKEIADSFPVYGRQYRYQYYDKIGKIADKIAPSNLSQMFDYCRKQIVGNGLALPESVTKEVAIIKSELYT